VAVHKRTEEQRKDFIFDTFNKCRDEIASSRLQVNFQILCEQIYMWYRDYMSNDADKIGLEIAEVINHFVKDNVISKVPQDKDEFFKYLKASIKTEKIGSSRKFNEKEIIKIPKDKKRKLKEVKDFIRMKESQLGRTLTTDEQIQGISKWFKITEKEAIERLELINIKYVKSLSYTDDDENKEIEVADTHSENPFDEYTTKINIETLQEAIKFALEKRHEKVRDCYMALFTLYCIKKNLRELYPILDKEIIDAFHRDGKKPKQYEIYMKYHPEVDKKSAEAEASTNRKEFLKDIETYLKKENK